MSRRGTRDSRYDLPRLARTLAPFELSQLAWRVRYSLERMRPFRRDGVSLPANLEACIATDLRKIPEFHGPDVDAERAVTNLEQGRFEHLNESRRLGPPPVDWLLGQQSQGRLWAITLHYHRWLDRLAEGVVAGGDDGGAAERLLVAYLDDWLVQCDLQQPGARELVWNAFAIATRLGWWSRAYRRLEPTGWSDRHPKLHRRWLESFWRQAEYLAGHLEWDLRANHLLRDGVGLLWAGRFFDHPKAQEWLRTGTDLVLSQADEQVLSDGGHFERSPMYHVHVLEDLVTAGYLVRDEGAKSQLDEVCRRMAAYSAWVRHPDGEIVLLNDAAMGAVSSPVDAIQAVRTLGGAVEPSVPEGSRHFEDSGLVVHHGRRWSAFLDIGPIGADCQPGHAHADTFTVSASVDGHRLLVDPGTYGYDNDPVRRYDRSTSSHNTVCIDGEDSSEVWHIFRVGRRATVHEPRVNLTQPEISVSAWHDGYEHLPGRPRHRRTLRVDETTVHVIDVVEGRGYHELTGGFLFDPAWSVERDRDDWVLRRGGSCVRMQITGAGLRQRVGKAAYHPEYGRELETQRVSWTVQGELPCQVETRFEVES